MKEFDDMPRCCEDAITAACDSCRGFDENCAAYRAAADRAADMAQRFRRDYAEEIAELERRQAEAAEGAAPVRLWRQKVEGASV